MTSTSSEARSLGSLNTSASTSVLCKIAEDEEYTMLQRPTSFNHGFSVWDSAIGFAKLLRFNSKIQDQLRGANVLEFGCGCGLLGCVLHRLNSREESKEKRPTVMITDLAEVVENAMSCMASNAVPALLVSSLSSLPKPSPSPSSSPILAMAHSWGDPVFPLFENNGLKPFDVIIGTDVLYSRALLPRLMRSMALAAWTSDYWQETSSSETASSTELPPSVRRLKAFETAAEATIENKSEEDSKTAVESSGAPRARPRCTLYLGNEIRCTATHEAFLKLGALLFDPFKQLNKRAVGAEIAESGVIVFEMRLKREHDTPAKIVAVIDGFVAAEGL